MSDTLVLILVMAFLLAPTILPLLFIGGDAVLQKVKSLRNNRPKMGKALISAVALLLSAAIGLGVGYHGFQDKFYQSGYDDGKAAALTDAVLQHKYQSGKAAGRSEGYNDGYSDGYDKGYSDGYFDAEVDYEFHEDSSNSYYETETIVYVTNTGSKYHRSWCSYLHSSSNAVYLSWATSNGYSACSRCW